MVRTLTVASLVSRCAASSHSQVVNGRYMVRLEHVASGLVAPVQAKTPADGTHRLFIVEHAGAIRIIQNAVLLLTPFHSLASLRAPLNTRDVDVVPIAARPGSPVHSRRGPVLQRRPIQRRMRRERH